MVREEYEQKAKPCSACETPGACCLDAHFVNVHITRLEAAAIRKVLGRLPEGQRRAVAERIDEAVLKYGLADDGDTFKQTYACPLFDKQAGCLVHDEGKPLPCIHHACYEKQEDLPPDELLESATEAVEMLNRRCYDEPPRWRPLPLWLRR